MEPTTTPSALSKANTTFCLSLFEKLSDDDKTGNIFYSPFSISSALAMVLLGARGETAKQMSECLNFPPLNEDGEDPVRPAFKLLLSEVTKQSDCWALNVANRLYGDQSCQFIKAFLSQIKDFYEAELEAVDFKTKSEEARAKINKWVKEQTQGKMEELVSEGGVNALSRLVLVNAIYFKGAWTHEFEPFLTKDRQFKVTKEFSVPVQMMNQERNFPCASIPEAKCKILEMPYKGEELSMLIFLPDGIEDDSTGLEKLEKQLTYDKFVEWTKKLDVVRVNVHLPRFKMEKTYDLKNILKNMGMEDVFDHKSDLSGMSTAEQLFVSKIAHQARVDVNEKGTEAAAATGAFSQNTMGYLGVVEFNADHPFLFFIQHTPTKSILFTGRFCSPV